MRDAQLLKGSVATLVLKLLSENDMYGYEIIKEMENRSRSEILLSEGALYPVLHKLEKTEHISSYWEEGVRRRKYYHLTQSGAVYLQEKLAEWSTFSSAVNLVLEVGG